LTKTILRAKVQQLLLLIYSKSIRVRQSEVFVRSEEMLQIKERKEYYRYKTKSTWFEF
jgi:hypothetical protein